jgi:hypothetical protein
MKVTLNTSAVPKLGADLVPPGTELDLPNEDAKGLIKAGIATAVAAPKKESAPPPTT